MGRKGETGRRGDGGVEQGNAGVHEKGVPGESGAGEEVGRLVEEEAGNDGEELPPSVEGDLEDDGDEPEEESGEEEDGRVPGARRPPRHGRGGGSHSKIGFLMTRVVNSADGIAASWSSCCCCCCFFFFFDEATP